MSDVDDLVDITAKAFRGNHGRDGEAALEIVQMVAGFMLKSIRERADSLMDDDAFGCSEDPYMATVYSYMHGWANDVEEAISRHNQPVLSTSDDHCENPVDFVDDGEREALWDEGAEAALHSWGGRAACPYEENSERASIWWVGFNHAFAKQNT